MTSHEMRNPLSAIVQCADSIAAVLSDFDGNKSGGFTMSKDDAESSLDAAQTIALCAQHQTRIIDDVLTLSKLDSNLLHITPVACQPAVVVENSLKIFDGELRKNDVKLRLVCIGILVAFMTYRAHYFVTEHREVLFRPSRGLGEA